MIENGIPAVNIEELKERIRAEVKQRKKQGTTLCQTVPPANFVASTFSHVKIDPLDIPAVMVPEKFEFKEVYHINDFLKFRDRNFVIAAYRGILKRGPDSGGLGHFLAKLRSGKMTKAEILGRLRYASEGRVKKTRVEGLFWNFLIQSSFRIPVLGYFFRLVTGIVNLPLILNNMGRFEEHASTALESRSNDLAVVLNKMGEIIEALEHLNPVLNGKIDSAELLALKAEVSSALDSKAGGAELSALKAEVSSALDSKAGGAELSALKAEVSSALDSKAGGAELSALKAEVSSALDSKAGGAELLALKAEVSSALDSKAGGAELSALKAEVSSALDSKAGGAELSALKAEVSSALDSKAGGAELSALKAEVSSALDSKAGKDLLEDVNDRIREILREIRGHKLNILDQQRRLMFLLEEARKRFPEPISTDQIKAMLTEEDHILDAMYVSLEDRFRGTRADIKERQRVYLPYLEDAGLERKKLSILDVGCGRGEWLELLKAEGFKAQGVDINPVLVNECKERGLEVFDGDAISFLRELPDAGLSVLTAFHMIEHLPLKTLIALLDEALRVIKPGGRVIFETPNPENLIVGACNFYADPTHRNPLHPELTKFIVEERGFCSVSLHRLHPVGKDYGLPEDGTEIVKRLNTLFYGPQDYAVVGTKP